MSIHHIFVGTSTIHSMLAVGDHIRLHYIEYYAGNMFQLCEGEAREAFVVVPSICACSGRDLIDVPTKNSPLPVCHACLPMVLEMHALLGFYRPTGPCPYCGETHGHGACITPETAGGGGMGPLEIITPENPETPAWQAGDLSWCTSCGADSEPHTETCPQKV